MPVVLFPPQPLLVAAPAPLAGPPPPAAVAALLRGLFAVVLLFPVFVFPGFVRYVLEDSYRIHGYRAHVKPGNRSGFATGQ